MSLNSINNLSAEKAYEIGLKKSNIKKHPKEGMLFILDEFILRY